MRNSLHVVAVAAMLALAGCSGVTAPTNQATDRPHTYPPGVSADGVENVSAVVDAHNESVLEQGAVRTSHTVLNGTTSSEQIHTVADSTVRLAPNGTEFRWTVHGTNTLGNDTGRLDERYYANESTLVTRVSRNGDVTVRERNRTGLWNRAIRYAATQTRIVNATLSNANYTVTDTEWRNGRAVTTLVAENGTFSGDRPVTEYDATVEIAASGRVLSIKRSWITETDTTSARYTSTIVWENTTAVEPPAWLPRNTTTGD